MGVIKFAIVGCGRISDKHIEAIKKIPSAELVGICDSNREKADMTAKNSNVQVYYDYSEMLEKTDADVIDICTPSGLHCEMTIEAAKAGKHVMTEKPMALKLSDADLMLKTCRENNVQLFVVKQNRYNPPIVKLYGALKKGRFGKLFLLNTTVRWSRPQEYYDRDSWRGTKKMDGGVLLNQASHHIDLLLWLGGPVKSVFAITDTLNHNIEVEDIGVAILNFENGAIGVIETTTCIYPKNMEGSLSVFGEKGSAKVGGVAVNKIDHWDFSDYENDDELIVKHSTNPPNVYGFGHIEYIKNVIGAIQNNKVGLVDGEEGRKSLELIEAIYKSAETGKKIFI